MQSFICTDANLHMSPLHLGARQNFCMTVIGNMQVIGNMTVTIDLEVGRGAKVDVA